MKKELDEYLCKKYPKIFVNRNKSPQETCMCWGFPGDGWFNLIDSLCRCIQSHIDSHNEWVNDYGKKYVEEHKNEITDTKQYELIPQVVADQVKEKFGTLRYYYSGGDDVIRGMVRLAEVMSASTCELCGSTDNVVVCGKSWIKSMCLKCREKERPDEVELHKERLKEMNYELP